MAVTHIIRIRNLLPELLANALILLRTLKSAGTVSTRLLQTILNHLYDFPILIEPNCHIKTFLPSIN